MSYCYSEARRVALNDVADIAPPATANPPVSTKLGQTGVDDKMSRDPGPKLDNMPIKHPDPSTPRDKMIIGPKNPEKLIPR